MRRSLRATLQLLPLAAMLCTPGCEEPVGNTGHAPAPVKPLAVTPRMSLPFDSAATLVNNFRSHFRLSSKQWIDSTEREIAWDEVRRIMGTVNATNRAIVFHYGLENGVFMLGLSPVKMETTDNPRVFKYDYRDSVYTVIGDSLSDKPMLNADWVQRYTYDPQGNGTYFGGMPYVEVLPDDAPTSVFEQVDTARDVRQEMMPFEIEIERLHRENPPPAGQAYHTYLAVRCAAEYDKATGRYQHKLCLHIRHRLQRDHSNVVDALRVVYVDGSHPTPFTDRAADLGNLCPPNPNCGTYDVPPAFLKDLNAHRPN